MGSPEAGNTVKNDSALSGEKSGEAECKERSRTGKKAQAFDYTGTKAGVSAQLQAPNLPAQGRAVAANERFIDEEWQRRRDKETEPGKREKRRLEVESFVKENPEVSTRVLERRFQMHRDTITSVREEIGFVVPKKDYKCYTARWEGSSPKAGKVQRILTVSAKSCAPHWLKPSRSCHATQRKRFRHLKICAIGSRKLSLMVTL